LSASTAPSVPARLPPAWCGARQRSSAKLPSVDGSLPLARAQQVPRAREVVALALPALGALAAEPLYVLGDTAIVGHLGRIPLAGLAIAGTLLSEVVGLCTFLEYGTTAKAARLYGAGQQPQALDVGVQATWLALALGTICALALELAAGPALRLIAGSHDSASLHQALTWFRIAALGAPFMLVIAAAQGWLRAFQDTRTGFMVLVASNLASVGLSLTLIRGFGLGIEGSAIANVASQVAAAAVFGILLVRRAPSLAPSWQRMLPQLRAARDLGLRSLAFTAAFLLAAAVAARMGDAQVAAHTIGFQLWIFVALALDSVAIAAQALIGRLLGAGAVDAAATLARRLLVAGLVFGVGVGGLFAAGHHLVPELFTSDAEVRRQAGVLWPWLVGMMPVAGVLFALDGVFFGAGDLAFMRRMTLIAALAAFLPILLAAHVFKLGLGGVWAGIAAFIGVRMLLGGLRWRSRRWLVAGALMVDEHRGEAGSPPFG
jgi:putative MATE family efflux protein